ncbi:MAG: CoA pyrophosphatase [Chloroflexi bacterium]|nr:CoA pyrophosphatase [Chloroflexota bacterium]
MTQYVDRANEAPALGQVRQAAASHDVQTLPPDIGRWRAAVLIALLPYDDPAVVLTVRSQHVEHHKGEISFPGGALDSLDEHPMAAALREADEEVGLRAEHVDVLGEQSHYRTMSDFHVTPYIGIIDRAPYPFRPLAVEVGEIITPSLTHLLDPTNVTFEQREHDGEIFHMREYWYEGHRIFGATATMLGRFLDDLSRLRGLPLPVPA